MDSWDVVVVGAGAAGLSAALVLGRARRRTLVVDAGAPSNAPAHGVGGLLGHDRRPPAELHARGREELAAYPGVVLREGEVVGLDPDPAAATDDPAFVVALAGGERVRTRRVLLATGVDYRRPALPGVEERWGRSVFHCPFCHGWEVRERPLGVLDSGSDAVHRALLLTAWSDEVTIYAGGPVGLDAGEAARLAAAGVAVQERPVVGLRGPGADLEAVVLEGGEERACGGLLVPVVLHQRTSLAERLGVATERTPLAADGLGVDERFATSVPGVWAAGDATGRPPSVASAIASGSMAAAMVVADLVVLGAAPATDAGPADVVAASGAGR